MKGFAIYHNGGNFAGAFRHASEVMKFLEDSDYLNYNYEIDWMAPITGDYTMVVKCDGRFISFNRDLFIPCAFKKLI